MGDITGGRGVGPVHERAILHRVATEAHRIEKDAIAEIDGHKNNVVDERAMSHDNRVQRQAHRLDRGVEAVREGMPQTPLDGDQVAL